MSKNDVCIVNEYTGKVYGWYADWCDAEEVLNRLNREASERGYEGYFMMLSKQDYDYIFNGIKDESYPY